MKFELINIGKGTYGTGGTQIAAENLYRIDSKGAIVDPDELVTEEELSEAIAAIPPFDPTGLATEEYVNDLINTGGTTTTVNRVTFANGSYIESSGASCLVFKSPTGVTMLELCENEIPLLVLINNTASSHEVFFQLVDDSGELQSTIDLGETQSLTVEEWRQPTEGSFASSIGFKPDSNYKVVVQLVDLEGNPTDDITEYTDTEVFFALDDLEENGGFIATYEAILNNTTTAAPGTTTSAPGTTTSAPGTTTQAPTTTSGGTTTTSGSTTQGFSTTQGPTTTSVGTTTSNGSTTQSPSTTQGPVTTSDGATSSPGTTTSSTPTTMISVDINNFINASDNLDYTKDGVSQSTIAVGDSHLDNYSAPWDATTVYTFPQVVENWYQIFAFEKNGTPKPDIGQQLLSIYPVNRTFNAHNTHNWTITRRKFYGFIYDKRNSNHQFNLNMYQNEHWGTTGYSYQADLPYEADRYYMRPQLDTDIGPAHLSIEVNSGTVLEMYVDNVLVNTYTATSVELNLPIAANSVTRFVVVIL